jgi:NeuB family
MPEILIGDGRIGPGHPAFVIAEAGINHNGAIETALDMVAVAQRAGADAIKFQTFTADEFVGDRDQTYTYRSHGREVTESMPEMFRRYELPRTAWAEIKAACDRHGILFMSTPQNRSDLDLLLEVGVPAVKVGSDDFTNLPLLESHAATGLPLILSCGMADLGEVHRSLEAVGALDGYPTVLLLCTSQYPTPPEDVNLRKLATLQAAFPMVPLGLSDHTTGRSPPPVPRRSAPACSKSISRCRATCPAPTIGSPNRRPILRPGSDRSTLRGRCSAPPWSARRRPNATCAGSHGAASSRPARLHAAKSSPPRISRCAGRAPGCRPICWTRCSARSRAAICAPANRSPGKT